MSSRASRPANTSYARITRQYVPAAALLVVVAVAISIARRELTPGLRGVTGDVAEAVVLAVIAIAGIGIAIVRPFERRMHERRRVSSQREHAYRAETERRDFERRIVSGLDLCEDMSDILVTTRRAMVDASGHAPSELLLANARDLFERAVSTGEGAPGCLVDGPGGARQPAAAPRNASTTPTRSTRVRGSGTAPRAGSARSASRSRSPDARSECCTRPAMPAPRPPQARSSSSPPSRTTSGRASGCCG